MIVAKRGTWLVRPSRDAADRAGGGSAQWLGPPVLLGLMYFAILRLSFPLSFYPKPVATFVTPHALVLAALLVTPTKRWWPLLTAALVAHVAFETLIDALSPMSVVWFLGNCGVVLLAATALRRYVPTPVTLDRFRSLCLFLLFGAFLTPFISSHLDAAMVMQGSWGSNDYWAVWQDRIFSNTLAALITVPPIVAWQGVSLRSLLSTPTLRVAEAAVLTVGLGLVSLILFARPGGGLPAPALLYAPLPLLVWAAVRFGQRGMSISAAGVALYSIWHAVNGQSPLARASAAESILSVQLFGIVVLITLLSLAALLEDRKRAEEIALRKNEQLRLALEAAQMAPWDWPAAETKRWLETSRRFLAGRQSDAVFYIESFNGSIHPGDLETVTNALEASIDTGEPFRVEFRVIDRGGRVKWLVGRGKMLRDADGTLIRMSGLTTDNTDRKRAEILIAGENRILKMIATGASFENTLTNLIKLIESESEGLIGSVLMLEQDGVHVRHCAAPSLPDSFVSAINGMAIGPKVGSCGSAMFRRATVIVADIQRDELWADYRVLAAEHGLRAAWSTPIMSNDGKVLGSFAMYYREVRRPDEAELHLIEIASHLATIVLGRKRAELEAHEQQNTLAHLSRVAMMGELAGAYAHELTQPLTAVLSNAQAAQRLLTRESPNLEEIREILADIVAADMRASNVIHSLRPMLIKGKSQMALIDVNQLVLETQKLASADIEARDVQMKVVLEPNLPAVMGERVQLQQVLLNLIVNACDAMSEHPPTERRLTVRSQLSPIDKTIELLIADRGPGIPAHIFDRIFDPFLSSKENGLGLGLSISRSIVQVHGGRLWAVNNPDQGATFHLALPKVHS